MNATQIHLAITHLPVFGLFLSLVALSYGLIKKSKQVKIISLVLLVISVSGGIIAFQTGEPAEERLEAVTSISESTIEEHEESAESTVILFYALAIAAIATLILLLKEKRIAKQMLFATLLLHVITFASVLRTASLGGKIRHTELTQQAGTTDQGAQESEEDEDDD
jgi:uncharacterized membrane protein